MNNDDVLIKCYFQALREYENYYPTDTELKRKAVIERTRLYYNWINEELK